MIPSLVVSDIRTALVEFLSTTFALSDDGVRDELARFLDDPTDGIFRGPYLRVRTPFRAADVGWEPPLDWWPEGFVPYQHQATAVERLSSAEGRTPRPTIVTTGTGSGKTECFLYPILDHCARERRAGRPGIKALILYPMNALASDQAGRLAELIATDGRLGGITAGLYVGEQGRYSAMGRDHLIDRREVLRADPPDILLTNYKMLDFLLLRREDRNLWAANDPDTLRYVVLDEFHTYDGAQGTDVAMLLRRLGRTLGTARAGQPLGDAVPVATSATLGSEPTASADLRDFAGKVFGVDFDSDAIVGETRQTVEEACSAIDYRLPVPEIDALTEVGDDLQAVAMAFCAREMPDGTLDHVDATDVVELGDRLLAHPLTRAVLAAVSERPRAWPDAVAEINTRTLHWGRAALTRQPDVERALGRFLWLLSLARRRHGDRLRPLFAVEVQLWIREVSRLLRRIDPEPGFRWLDSTSPTQATGHLDGDDAAGSWTAELPAVYCRRCGMSGWMAIQSELGGTMLTSTAAIYQAALGRSAQVRVLLSTHPSDPNALWYDPKSRQVVPSQGAGVPVLMTVREDDATANRCPGCDERDAIRFLGLQVASLASVAVNTLFGSPYVADDERKLLAFTDSVQDASHRAAFFSGRTHRINLRTQMAKHIADRGDMSLVQLGDALMASATEPRARFSLVPPDLTRHPLVRTVWSDQPDPRGLELLARRIGFEVDLEFGLRARVGRTLELCRASAASVDLTAIDPVVALVEEDLQRLDPGVTGAALTSVGVYLRGLVERLRLRGGLVNSLLDPYINEGGRQWFVWGGRPDGLPPFTPGQGRPVFYTSAPTGDFDSMVALSTTPTWAVDWAARTLGIDAGTARDLNVNALTLLADGCAAIVERKVGRHQVWGINRAHVRVWDVVDQSWDEPTEAAVRCELCGARHPVPAHLLDSWRATPCLRYRCAGRYQADVPRMPNYYRKLYRSGVTRRVVAAEHTGLLGRRQREDLERSFKEGTQPDAPNVVTATPTLEMGIDIGDLSAVMLTSVPRNSTSYVQRVGRAGRLTGNSLVTTFARTDTHDLYFLSEPEAMIAGVVRPPSCYLDATETLRRQYVAYLLDRIADLAISGEPLPGQIRAVMATGLDADGVLRRIIDQSMLQPDWAEQFLELFAERITTATADDLREFATAGIEPTVKEAVETWRRHDHELSIRQSRLRDAIDRLTAQPHRSADDDEALGSLRGQRAAIIRLLRDHRNEYSLTALERLGLLPNYTLLDDSTTLQATMWWRSDEGEYQTDTVEYARAGRLAIRELAPGNSFYAGGHRHRIDAVEMGTSDEPLYEQWRLCPECGYGAIETDGTAMTTCPRCGSPHIVDTGARHTLLRLRTVLSSASEESARVYDESDDRQRERYDAVTTIDVDPAHVSGAWKLIDQPFGVEWSGQTHLRSLNLGFADRKGERIAIAGDDRHVTRFTVCRHCGAVRDVRDDGRGARPERLHQGWCKVRSGSVRQQWDPIVLLHQLTTEAVRILIPVSMFEVDERLASFKGSLLIGLREYFGGDPDHLVVARSEFPNRGGQGKRRFLVLYDDVPGGTGYLGTLARPETIKAILESARLVISRCPCRAEGRAACHRCLLGVVDRHEYPLARRDLALEILDDLLEPWDVESVPSVAEIDIGRVEESELERRFKVAIHDWVAHPGNEDATLTPAPGVDGHDAFELHFTYEGETIRYLVREQEGLGTTPSTVPDFVIHRQDDKAPDIAVYLDGYQFHASPANNNLAADAAKRTAVRESGRIVWNLTWEDVTSFHAAVQGDTIHEPPRRPLLSASGRTTALHLHAARKGRIDFDSTGRNAMSLLIELLRRPDLTDWERLARSAVGGAAASGTVCGVARQDDIGAVMRSAAAGQPISLGGGDGSGVGHHCWQWTSSGDQQLTLLLDAADPNDERWKVVSTIPDTSASVASPGHHERWRDWHQWSNLLQFLHGAGSNAIICASSQADTFGYDELDLAGEVPTSAEPLPAAAVVTELTAEQTDELDLVIVDAVRDLIRQALFAGAPEFIAGLEHEGESLEASWPDRRVAVTREDQDLAFADWDARPASQWTVAELLAALDGAG
jgi:hypothetical protein